MNDSNQDLNVSHHHELAHDHSGEAAPLFRKITSEYYIDRFDTRKLYMGLKRHILLIILTTLLFTALAGYGSYYFLTTYQAEAVVLYQEEKTAKNLAGNFSLINFTMPTAIDMIKLPSNFQAVKAILGLDLTTKQLDGMVDVPTPRNESTLIRIVAKGDNGNLVVDIVNTLAKTAVRNSQDFTQRQLQSALENYRNQLELSRQKLASQLKEIEDFKKSHQYFEMTAEHSMILRDMQNARARFQDAELSYSSLLVEYENLKREAAALPELVAVSMESSNNPLQTRIISLEAALAEARSHFAKDNPKIGALEGELKELRKQMLSGGQDDKKSQMFEKNSSKEKLDIELMRMQGKVRSAQKTKQDLSQTVSKLEKEAEGLPTQQVAFAKLLQQKSIIDEQVHFLTNAVETTQLMINIPRGSLELYQLADKAKPLRDNWVVYVLPFAGFLFGLLTGMLISVFIEMRDKRIWTPKQIELAYHVPSIGVVPEFTFFSPKNAEEKTLYFIRALAERLEPLFKKDKHKSLQGITSKHQATIITVTSSVDREGKSWICHYLAQYYTKLGRKTLLMELDHHPNVFADEIPGTASIEEYLRGDADLKDTIAEGKPDRLHIKGIVQDMKELVKSPKMHDLWNHLRNSYDVVFVDSPGVLQDDYSLNLAEAADATVFVIGATQVERNIVNQSLEELHVLGVRPFGILLNRVLTTYIDDERVKLEMKRNRMRMFQKFFAWKGQ